MRKLSEARASKLLREMNKRAPRSIEEDCPKKRFEKQQLEKVVRDEDSSRRR